MPKEVTETILKEAKEGMMAMSRNRNIDIEIREIIDKEKIDKEIETIKKEPNGNSGVKKYNRNEKLTRELHHYFWPGKDRVNNLKNRFIEIM